MTCGALQAAKAQDRARQLRTETWEPACCASNCRAAPDLEGLPPAFAPFVRDEVTARQLANVHVTAWMTK